MKMANDCCIYVRISNDPDADTDDGGQGVARQEQDCRALADRLGWAVTGVYSDNDISAYNGKTRPGFEDMLDGIKRGQYDGLICWHTDRLTRSMKDLERVIEVCDGAGVPIRTVNGGDLDVSNATGKMLARILGSVSRQESEHKAERQRRANVQRAEAGGWWSSHRVFGYNEDATVREDEAALIRRAAADALTGVSMRAIARQMDADGSRTSAGKRWNNVNLKRLLMNPRHAGLRTYHGKVVGPGDWPAILDADTHAGLVAVLSDPSRGPATVNYERKYVGSQRYICGQRTCTCGHQPKQHAHGGCEDCDCTQFTAGEMCGAKMHHTVVSQSNGKRFHRYACTASAHLGRTQPELDAYVEQVALKYMHDSERLARILATKKNNGVDPAELRTRRAALAAQKDELATLFTDGILDGPAVRRESAKLQQKIGAIDTALAELARRSPLADLMAEGVEKLDERWADASPDMRGKVIDELFTVVVNPSPKGRYFRPEYIDFVEVQR
jgi:DNA invertase Pin-like site-specific DNA recombinase